MNANDTEVITPDPEYTYVIQYYRNLLDTPREAIEAAHVGTWLIDEKTRIFLPSVLVKVMYGYLPEEDLSFEAFLGQIPEQYRPQVSLRLEETFSKGAPFHMDFPVVGRHDGALRWIKALGGLYQAPPGQRSHLSGVIVDITEYKEKERRKNKFISMVSHELKAPLTVLKGYIQILHSWAEKKKENFAVGTLSKLEKQVRKMGHMITGFLSLSRGNNGKIQLTLNDVELNKRIQEVVEEIRFLNPGRNISFIPHGPVWVRGDEDKIGQVVINFLSNAIKYSPEHSVIQVFCIEKDSKAEVCVKDEGIGIAQEDIGKLFNRFYRVENQQTERIAGFGIGLYVCAEIIKAHSGKIWVESEPGKGAAFFFSLPVGQKNDMNRSGMQGQELVHL